MDPVELKGKIVKFEVTTSAVQEQKEQRYHILLDRPQELEGSTWKVEVPESVFPDSLYVTINNIEVRVANGQTRKLPFEMFFNTAAADNNDMLKAISLLVSGHFREHCSRGELANPTFVVQQLRKVFASSGPYHHRGRWHRSLIGQVITDAVEPHFRKHGLLPPLVTDKELEEKRKKIAGNIQIPRQCTESDCGAMAVYRIDGCDTCTVCGFSRCG